MVRRTIGAMAVAAGVLLTSAASAQASTYVANCGIPSYLEVKPDAFSGGCTGGSLNIEALRWRSYGRARAAAVGRAELREPCGDQPCYRAGTYKARARLRFSAPRTCAQGPAAGERYFSRVRVRVRMRSGNPFGLRAGWKVWWVRIPSGDCDFSP